MGSVLLVLLLAGCPQEGARLEASDLRILQSRADLAVAYFSLANGSDRDEVLVSASSPHFGSVEIHESTMTDSVMRMRRRASVTIPKGDAVQFESGGLHLMLFGPKIALSQPAILQLSFESGLELTLQTTLRRRD